MNIKTRRDYFAGILMFKTIQGQGVNYLSSELTYTNQYHNYSNRAASNNIFVLSKPNCEIYKTSFRYYAVNLWNSLPNNVKLSVHIAEFKRAYKQYLGTMFHKLSSFIFFMYSVYRPMLYFLFFVIFFVCVFIRALLKNSFVN